MSALVPESDDSEGEEAPELVSFGSLLNVSEGAVMVKRAGPGGTSAADRALTGDLEGKVPVTILCGFLGSGKTTLLKRLVLGDHGLEIAVVENEFGDTQGLESIIATEGERTLAIDGSIVELRNGCVCCSVKDELVSTLETRLDRRRWVGSSSLSRTSVS